MADFSKFRTSIGGFNRTDVSEYIESLCAEHRNALRQCEEEKTTLAGRLAEAEKTLLDQRERNAALLEEIREKDAALRAAEQARMESEPEASEAEEEEATDYPSLELEAYRRAEAAERLAMERAARLRQNLNELLNGVSNRYDEAGREICALTEDMRTNLKRLEDTLSELDLLFDETTDSFAALNGSDAALLCE